MPDGLTAELSALAEEHDAAAFGVAGAEPFQGEALTLQSQKQAGRSGPLRFTYDNPNEATDVTRSFPWAQRLVVVGWSYLARSATPAPQGAVVGRFATNDQYDGVRRVTSALAAHLRQSGYRAEELIDDNRLLDRAAAVRAGLGWTGKSTMVLAPGHGPWMLLGSVVTDAPLTISQPMQRDCGTCVACFPACPTNALSDRGLDARRCLSTWLQTPGSIPQWIRPILGRRIYGCDDCLTACPPGKRAFAAAGDRPLSMPFPELLAQSDDELLERFSWWYVPRREGRFLRRNLLVAAGNSSEPKTWEPIEAHLTHPSSMIRGHAAWAMARGFGVRARAVLGAALESETASETRDELVLALLMVEHPERHRALLTVDEWVRTEETLRGLAVIGSHASADGRTGSDLDLLVVHTGATPPPAPDLPAPARIMFAANDQNDVDRLEEPMARVYDPDRTLERSRREIRSRSAARV